MTASKRRRRRSTGRAEAVARRWGRHLATALAAVVLVLGPVMTVIGNLADNLAVLAVADAKLYVGAVLIGVSIGVGRLAVTWKRPKALHRLFLVSAVVAGTVVGAVVVVPKVVRAVATPAVTPVPAAQSSPLITESATLAHAVYSGRDLTGSRLSRSVLEDVDFDNATLDESDLRDSVLRRVNLAGVSLCGADLRGADLSGAVNAGRVRDWNFVFYDERTKWPGQMDPMFLAGPVLDVAGSMIYSCGDDRTRQVLGDGSRK